MNSRAKIPVTVVTGFLGSGKTTLIAKLLRQPGMDGTLVVVNEFGEVGIDHDLLESSSEDTVLLANGCFCCTIRGNLVDTLDSALAQQVQGRLRSFDRVIVETSGLADPAPFLAFLYEEQQFLSRFTVAGVVTVCDAVALEATLKRFPEAVSQVRMADRVIISKSDLVSQNGIEFAQNLVRAINPEAEVLHAVMGDIDALQLLDLHRGPPPQTPGHRHQHHHDHDAEMAQLRHRDIERLAFVLPALQTSDLAAFQQSLKSVMGPHVLRVKGLLRLCDDEHIAVIQGTMTSLAPPQLLSLQIEGEGRLVFLLQGAQCDSIAQGLSPFGARPWSQQR